MTDTTVTTAAPSENRIETAQRLIDAWCRMHKCAPGDIVSKIVNWRSRKNVEVLLYALRKVADVDIIPTAEMLGIEPSAFMKMSRGMRVLIEEGNDPQYTEMFNELLVAAGLRKAEEKKPEEDLSYEYRLRRARGHQEAKARRERMWAERSRPLNESRRKTAQRVCEIIGIPYEAVLVKSAKATDVIRARAIIHAIVYALDEEKNVSSIARSFETTDITVRSGLRRVTAILSANSELEGEWQEKIVKACKAFKISTERLLLGPKV